MTNEITQRGQIVVSRVQTMAADLEKFYQQSQELNRVLLNQQLLISEYFQNPEALPENISADKKLRLLELHSLFFEVNKIIKGEIPIIEVDVETGEITVTGDTKLGTDILAPFIQI